MDDGRAAFSLRQHDGVGPRRHDGVEIGVGEAGIQAVDAHEKIRPGAVAAVSLRNAAALCRARALPSSAIESSRSTISASAPLVIAFVELLRTVGGDEEQRAHDVDVPHLSPAGREEEEFTSPHASVNGNDGAHEASLLTKPGGVTPEHRDDGDDGGANRDFDQRCCGAIAGTRLASALALASAASRGRKPKPIDRGDRHHAEEQRDLDQQEMAVIGLGQRGNAARQIPGVDCTGDQKRRRRWRRRKPKSASSPCAPSRPMRLAFRGRKQQSERQQSLRPTRPRRPDARTSAAGWMMPSTPNAADAVSGPGQGPGKAGRQRRNGQLIQDGSAVASSKGSAASKTREQTGQHKPHQPVTAKIGFQEYGPEDAPRKDGGERLIAHRLRDQDEPRSPRNDRQQQADPGDPCEPGRHDRGHAPAAGAGWRKAGSAMKTLKKTTPATRDRRGEMNGAHKNQRVVHAVLPSLLGGPITGRPRGTRSFPPSCACRPRARASGRCRCRAPAISGRRSWCCR